MTRAFDRDMSMDEVMREWPATIRVILAHGMLCVGCPIAAFQTVADAAREHGIAEAELMRDLQAVINAGSMQEGRELSGALAFKQGRR